MDGWRWVARHGRRRDSDGFGRAVTTGATHAMPKCLQENNESRGNVRSERCCVCEIRLAGGPDEGAALCWFAGRQDFWSRPLQGALGKRLGAMRWKGSPGSPGPPTATDTPVASRQSPLLVVAVNQSKSSPQAQELIDLRGCLASPLKWPNTCCSWLLDLVPQACSVLTTTRGQFDACCNASRYCIFITSNSHQGMCGHTGGAGGLRHPFIRRPLWKPGNQESSRETRNGRPTEACHVPKLCTVHPRHNRTGLLATPTHTQHPWPWCGS